MNRSYDERADKLARYRPRPGVYAIITAPGGLLLTVQEKPWPELQLPGGGVDPGETPMRALYREVLEETGFRIFAPRRLGVFHRYVYMPEYRQHAQKQCTIYLAQLGPQISAPLEAGHWPIVVPVADAASKLAVAGDRDFVKRFFGPLSDSRR